jgi:acetyl-CoA synthetase
LRFLILNVRVAEREVGLTDAWAGIRSDLRGASGHPENITAWTLSRHVGAGAGDRIALRWRPRSGPTVSFTYSDLDRAASRFASGLDREGIEPGDTVGILAGRVPELLVALLGSLRAGAVPMVLFSSFGPDPVKRRLARGRARLLVATARLYKDKVVPIRDDLPELRKVLTLDGAGRLAAMAALEPPADGAQDLGGWLAQGDPAFRDRDLGPDAPALLHFTSGTTGEPKGVLHVHDAIVGHAHTAKHVLGLTSDTHYWCTADPGWVTGVSYGILAPLSAGVTLFMDEEEFDAQRWWENLSDERIQVLYTSPTALRLLRRMDTSGIPRPLLPSLRSVFAVGEPLAHPEARWAREALGVPVRDTWWQTETGCIVVATPYDVEPREGAVGVPVAGFEVACLDRSTGTATVVEPGVAGDLAVRSGWPSMFRAYVDDPELYRASFRDGWYVSGDLAMMDEEGWLHFVARGGDVFKSAGHLVSPAEVEAGVLDHPAVVDAGVFGREDELMGTIIEAYVVLASGVDATDTLRSEILGFARSRLGPALAPRALHFRDHLPRTPSGKIVRKDLSTPPS